MQDIQNNLEPFPITLFDSYKKTLFQLDPNSTVQKDTLKLYSCGPTIYSYQHIGNMRAAWFNDTLAKIAGLANWKVDWVMNITDAGHLVGDGDDEQNVSSTEDKIEKGARKEGKTAAEIVDFYLADYLLQASKLNLKLPTGKMMPKATEYIEEQMILALKLLQHKKAYLLEDGIYYDSQSGSVSKSLEKLESEAQDQVNLGEAAKNYTGRDIKNTTKNPEDFALWKFVDEKSLQKWRFKDFPEAEKIFIEISDEFGIGSDSFNQAIEDGNPPKIFEKLTAQQTFNLIYTAAIDFIWGCPGWHSECVAMISEIIGQKRFSQPNKLFSQVIQNLSSDQKTYEIDVHTGGIEHIPIHHKNEILQSEALGFGLSKYWVHFEHLLVDNLKMGKSLGNAYNIWDIVEKKYDPLAYKLLMFEHNYQDQMNFTWDKLTQAQNRLFNLRKEAAKVLSYYNYTKSVDLQNQITNSQTDKPVSENSQELSNESSVSPIEMSATKQNWIKTLANNIDTASFLEEYQNSLSGQSNLASKSQSLNTEIYSSLVEFDHKFLQLNLFSENTSEYKKVLEIGQERLQARFAKDFAKSDELRSKIHELGYQVDDFPWGFGIWWRGC